MENSLDLVTEKYNSLPRFNWIPARWAVTRTENVEKLYSHWKDDPKRVAVLEDPKLNDDKLVILKKEYLDDLLSKYEQSTRFYSERISSTKILFQTIDLVTDLAKTKAGDEMINKAFSILIEIRNQVSDDLLKSRH